MINHEIGNPNKNTPEVELMVYQEHPDAKLPKVAYSGTSAAFDLASIEDVIVPANSRRVVPVGLKISIDQHSKYYMTVHLRSSLGFKHGLRCHIGIIDAGYTGDFGISVVNNTDKDFTIHKGDYFAQVLVQEKPRYVFKVLDKNQWEEYVETQERGDGGFGSSGK